MFRIEMLPARHGDCLWIEYGELTAPHRILIDGGTSGTFHDLKKSFEAIPETQREFELLVVTHIDADHISGVLKLLESDLPGVRFKDIWFNGWRHLPESPLESLGPVQGERLTDLLVKPDYPWNLAFKGQAAKTEENGSMEYRDLEDGMRLTLLSPNQAKLAKLKPVWEREVKAAGLDPNRMQPELEEEDTRPSPLERLGSDNLPDIDALADSVFEEDSSEANGSSIALLAQYQGHSALLSGDAHPGLLEHAIDCLLTQKQEDVLSIDLFKLPHHGSKANISRELLEKLACDRYLISTSGAYFKHPDQAAIARVIKYGGDMPSLLFNYVTKYNKIWADTSLQQNHGYRALFPPQEAKGISIELS
ncbi:MAG: MBL fold metallo-hydrolase [Candidatus Thiodiazotropha sp.]|nr:MBL fold metallo-hydrolase [Candidatus Thiodiazotropha sp.]MCM8885585.1 MBL fold metallo-hydrolase [Candidatus Thiodiazotropha sp.]MCM8921987.1 MBL fold metallo-hydrolase [Candidatus Thiodiazotropha sp.]